MPPQSREVITALAKALNTDADELFALAVKLPPDVERMMLETPQLVQMVRVRAAWPESIRRLFLETRGVPLEKLDYLCGPLPNFDTDRTRREPITKALRLAVLRLDGHECVY